MEQLTATSSLRSSRVTIKEEVEGRWILDPWLLLSKFMVHGNVQKSEVHGVSELVGVFGGILNYIRVHL